MTFQSHWESMVFRQPNLRDDATTMKMTVAEFRRQLMRAYDSGWRDHTAVVHGVESAGAGFLDELFRKFR